MLKEIITAVQSYYKAHHFIRAHKLWKWIILPGIVYTILFIISIYFFGKTANSFTEWISVKSGLKTWLDKSGNGMLRFIFTFDAIIFWLIQMLFYFSLFKYFWLIVGSPVFVYLSEKTDAIITNKEFVFNASQFRKDMLRGIWIAIRNTLWQTVYMISIIIISLIPIAGWLMPLLALLIECYYYGFSMLDYSFERKKMNTAESIYFIGNHRGLAIGNGLMFFVMQLVPVIGWILAPAYAIVAATVSLYDIKDVIPAKTEA